MNVSRTAHRALTLLAALALVALLAACDGALREASLNDDVSNDLAAMLEESNRFVAGVLANPTGVDPNATLRAGLRAQAITGDCAITASGNETDADGDDVPVNASFSIDCGLQDTDTGAGIRIVGATRASDADDTDPLSGYTVATDRYTLTITDASANVYELGLDLDAALTRTGATYGYDLFFELSGSKPEGSGLVRYDTNATYTPDQAADPFAAGRLDYGGGLRFEHGGNYYQLTVTTLEPLHYVATCAGGFDDGSVRYQDSEGNRLTITYNGCNNVVAEFEGTEG